MYYKIGTGTVVYKYTITSELDSEAYTDDTDPFEIYPNSTGSARFEGSIDTPIGSCTFLTNARDFSGVSGTAKRIQGTLSSFGDSDSDTIDSTGSTLSITDGVFEVSCPCDICFETSAILTGSDELAQFFKRIEDTPGNTNINIYYIPVPGESTIGSLVLGSLSLSVIGTIGTSPAPIVFSSTYSGETNSGAVAQGGAGTGSGVSAGTISLHIDSTILSSSFAGITISKSGSGASASATTASESLTLNSSASASGIQSRVGNSQASRTFYGDRIAECSGIIAYPHGNSGDAIPISGETFTVDLNGMIDLTKTFSSGIWSSSVLQKKASQSVEATANGSTESDSNDIDEYTPVYAEIDDASLTTNGDDSTATRHMFRGEEVVVADITQEEVLNVDDGNSIAPTITNFDGDWSASTDWTIASVSGNIEFSGTVNNGIVTRSFDTGKGFFAGYRYLRISLFASEDTHFTLRINSLFGTKNWKIKHIHSGVTQYVYIDLMYPTGRPEKYDSNTTRYPEDEDEYPNESVYFGVGRAENIEFRNLKNDVNFRIESIDLVRQTATSGFTDFNDKGNFFGIHSKELFEWKPENVVSEVGTTTTFFQNRAIFFQQDAIGNSLEEGSLKKQITVGGGTGVTTISYSHESLQSIQNRLSGRYNGMTLTEINTWTPSGDEHPPAKYEFYNLDSPLAYVYGNGLLATNTSTWKIASAIDIDKCGIIQPVFDRISEFPTVKGNCDWFKLSDSILTDKPFTLKFGTILRTNVFGEVLEKNLPAEDLEVEVFQSSVTRGDDLTDTSSWYQTKNPSLQDASTEVKHKNITATITSTLRYLHRVIFRSGKLSPVNLLTGFHKRNQLSFYGESDRKTRKHVESNFEELKVGEELPEDYTVIWMDTDQQVGSAWYVLQTDDKAEYYQSFDGCITGRKMLEITGIASSAIGQYSKRGQVVILYEDTDGNLFQRLSRNQGYDFETAVAMKDQTGADMTGSIVGFHINPQTGVINILKSNDGIVTYYESFDQGKTWRQK